MDIVSPSEAIRAYFNNLGDLIKSFNFTRKGRDESLGKDAAHLVAESIIDRSVERQGGPEGKWSENSAKYTEKKRELYHVDLIGFRTGQMISMPSLLGQVDIAEHTVTMKYGTGKPPTGSMSSTYISPQDTQISDIEKSLFFSALKGGFYKLDDEIAGKVKAYFAEQLDDFIREANAR